MEGGCVRLVHVETQTVDSQKHCQTVSDAERRDQSQILDCLSSKREGVGGSP